MNKLDEVFAAIDAANALDPNLDANGKPACLVYGQKMSERLNLFAPQAGEDLAIAVRGQHIERWKIPRDSYPMDRAGYLRWRSDLKDVHSSRLTEIMRAAGYADEHIARVGQIVRKERFKTDPEAQTLEDVACLVFLEHYAADFTAKHADDKSIDIIRKTWRKMSDHGHEAALALALPPHVGELVKKALSSE
jgi:hypothetical protein